MRAKHQKHNYKGLLRRAIAVGMAAAMIYSTALSCSALETVEVVDDATDLPKEVEFTEFDEDTTDEDADEVLDDAEEPDSTEEKKETPEETTGESDEELPANEEETEEPTEDSEDFIDVQLPDEEIGEGKISVLSNSVSVAYYYKSSTDNKQGFYQDNMHAALINGTDSNTTMAKFIDDFCATNATIYMDSGYHVSSDEEWAPTSEITLNYSGTGRVLYVDNGGTLTLGGSLIVDGNNESKQLTAIEVCSGGTLKIKDNVVIRKCEANGNAGAVYVSGGELDMEGGTLSDNEATGYAGGVWVDGGTFKMIGGTIVGNKCGTYGGGVYVSGTNGKFEMSGGIISGNTAKNGGGVYVNDGTFEMSGGTIEKNTAANDTNGNGGGGVFVNSGTVKMYNGDILGNFADGRGAGVSMVGGTFDMYDGKISDNDVNVKTVGGMGGGAGVALGKSSEFNLYYGEISSNKAKLTDCYGAGVALFNGGDSCRFNMYGGVITKNESPYTSGVSGMNGRITIAGGTIVGNKHNGIENEGREVRINSSCKVIITGGTIRKFTGTEDRSLQGHVVRKDGDSVNLVENKVKVGSVGGVLVTSSDITFTGNDTTLSVNDYGFNDVYTDDEGYVYLWLPKGVKASHSGTEYEDYDYKAVIQKKVDVTKESGNDTYKTVTIADEMKVPYGTKLRADLEVEEKTTQQADDIQTYSLDGTETLAETTGSIKIKSYQWQVSTSRGYDGKPLNGDESGWLDIAGATERYLMPGLNEVGYWVRVVITTEKEGHDPYISEPVWIEAPTLSVTVPTTLTVIISPDGSCEMRSEGSSKVMDAAEVALYTTDNVATYANKSTNGAIINTGINPIYLTQVTFNWNTSTASRIFTNWATQRPKLILNNIEMGGNTEDSLIWSPNATIKANGGVFDLSWSFDLKGNSISQALQAGQEATIGTIVYTVSYQDPSKIGSTAA